MHVLSGYKGFRTLLIQGICILLQRVTAVFLIFSFQLNNITKHLDSGFMLSIVGAITLWFLKWISCPLNELCPTNLLVGREFSIQPFWFWRALKLKPWCCTIGGFSHGQFPKRLPLAWVIRYVWCRVFTGISTLSCCTKSGRGWTRSFTELRLLATADDLGGVPRQWFYRFLMAGLWRIRWWFFAATSLMTWLQMGL